MSLNRRRRQPELMDQPGLDQASHATALAGLTRINWWSRSPAVLWRAIEDEIQTSPQRVWKVLDIASGAGDVACGVARQAHRQGYRLEVLGCDVSPTAVAMAQERAMRLDLQDKVTFRVLDVLHEELPADFDIVMCSLFLHHLEQPEAQLLLQKMAAAARSMVLISDLRRTRMGYILAWAGTRVLSRSAIVHFDGPVSVEGAFTVNEVFHLARQAGMEGVQLSHHWPQRFLLLWKRGPSC